MISIFYEKEGGYHDFLFRTFCLTETMKFVGEHFCVSKEF